MTIQEQIWQAMLITNEIFVVFVKMFIASLESFCLTVVPPEEVAVEGEIVLITGTGNGIGKELALQYAALGATVVGCDVDTKNNNETVKEINERGYNTAYGFYCDVSNRDSVFEMAKKVESEVGNVTILVNNAGVLTAKSFLDYTPEVINKMISINVLAHFWTIQAFLPGMKKRNHGYIVAVSSAAGLGGAPNTAVYTTTKFAVRGLMEVLFNELRMENFTGVSTTTVFPFFVDTSLCKKPRFRFLSAFKMLSPKQVAEKIISAQRRKLFEMSLPGYLCSLNLFMRFIPLKAAMVFTDYLDVGMESD